MVGGVGLWARRCRNRQACGLDRQVASGRARVEAALECACAMLHAGVFMGGLGIDHCGSAREAWSKLSDVGVRGAGRRDPPEATRDSPKTGLPHRRRVRNMFNWDRLAGLRASCTNTSLQLHKAIVGCGAEFLHSFHYFPPASPALVYDLQHLRISSPSTQP
ncbi:hypothetical protein P171DRAFT_230292 [Karstenula rhodostoma CBS 690.94]|uniref:Uncharacterized protein n=1 Tax=Karstenula rhodostoma CBS 690.94 TaxID=1392251 RepID=A0A9P4UEQ2_9PLEO|nr:hypothetical protein P171DRAFT_230292 [Karstenula rhodostoma CBS 690.94]